MSNFFNTDLFYLVISALLILILLWSVFLQWQNFKIRKKLKTLFGSNKKAKDFEKVIFELIKKLDQSQKDISELRKFDGYLEKIALSSIQKVGVVRYNPFQEVGGDQSFSIALLDAKDNGVVITNLYSRQENRVYAKPLEQGISKYPLSGEEKEAIARAKSSK